MSCEEVGRLLYGLLRTGRPTLTAFRTAADRVAGGGELRRCSDSDLSNLVQAFGSHLLAQEKKVRPSKSRPVP